jgi:hypothetical protein
LNGLVVRLDYRGYGEIRVANLADRVRFDRDDVEGGIRFPNLLGLAEFDATADDNGRRLTANHVRLI